MPDLPPFEIKIDFERHSERPSRVFKTMSEVIESFQMLDSDLIIPFGLTIKPSLILEDITTGSLRSVLKNILNSVDDESLKSGDWKKVVGMYLLKAKHRVVEFLENKKEIGSKEELQVLENSLHELARETDITYIDSRSQIPTLNLLRDIGAITGALSHLKPTDSATYVAGNLKAQFNLSFKFHEDAVEEFLTKEIKKSVSEEVLQVKKPDYLGDSMWEFRFRGRIILAKIDDHDWLLRFQSRQIDVHPGDSLSVRLQTDISLGYRGEEVAVHYKLVKVNGIIPSQGQQTILL